MRISVLLHRIMSCSLAVGVLCAQSCPNPTTSLKPFTGQIGWEYGQTVDVYVLDSISRAFTPEEIIDIESGLTNWDNMLGSGINWTSHFVSTLPTLSDPYIVFQFGSCATDGCATTTPDGITGQTDHSVVTFSSGYTAPFDALAAHEIGHTYGLDDCGAGDCSRSVTIMYDNPITDRAHTLPVCCDKKRLYTMSGGDYGQYDPCTPHMIQGTADVDSIGTNNWSEHSVSATFDTRPDPGNSIVVGCMNINYRGGDVAVNDSSGNTYDLLISEPGNSDDAPVALFIANNIKSAYPLAVSCTLPGTHIDAINVFALEYSGLASTSVVDATASANTSANPLTCGTFSTSATNDIIVALYNNYTGNNPAAVSPTSGAIPSCSGGDGGACQALDGSIYEVGALATVLASSTGMYSPGFNGPVGTMSCATAAIKALGQ